MDAPNQEDAVLSHSGALERPSTDRQQPSQLAEQEDKRRVTLHGRVGAQPSFRTTPKGILIGKFPLAVRDQEEQTHWHSILAFNDRARKLQEAQVANGEAVEVTGYVHERKQQTKTGIKMVEEIYAVVIKQR